MDVKRMKQIGLIFLACAGGAVLLQLAAPLLLGILVNAASFAVPLCLYHFIVKKHWRIRLVRGEEPDHQEDKDAEDSGKENPNTKTENQAQEMEVSAKEEKAPEEADTWYKTRGKQRINQIVSNLYAQGIYECWIRTDGIINIRTQKGYRRAGNLPGYPEGEADRVSCLLRKDRLHAVDKGKYLYLSWAEE